MAHEVETYPCKKRVHQSPGLHSGVLHWVTGGDHPFLLRSGEENPMWDAVLGSQVKKDLDFMEQEQCRVTKRLEGLDHLL